MSQKTCHMFAIVSVVCAGASLIIGGAMMDVVGLVFGVLAFLNTKKLLAAGNADSTSMNTLKLAKIGIVLSIVAGIANVLTAVFLMPKMLAGTGIMGPTF